MPTLLENGGTVQLWGGWSVTLPPAYHERNPDGSWSAWGADWTIDVHIVEVSGDANDKPVPADEMLGNHPTINENGNGWVGDVRHFTETENGRDVYRLAADLGAVNTYCSFWVSYLEKNQKSFADELLRSIAHVR